MIDVKKIFGINLKKYRKLSGMTQEDLAEKIGISTKHLSNIEVGQKFVSSELIEKIFEILRITPSAMFYSAAIDSLGEDQFCQIDKTIDELVFELKEGIRKYPSKTNK